jgi:glycosyltransferase involved in cell wall biosynthesis
MKKLRIAQIAPLFESVPPQKYGGTERVVYYLTEGLVKSGHEVTLFASGDSVTSARLVAPVRQSLRLGRKAHTSVMVHMLMLSKAYEEMKGQFDIIHSHLEYITLPYAAHSRTPTIMTMHGRLDVPDYADILNRYSMMDYVSISDSQRLPAPDLNWAGTVYHGYPENLFEFNNDPAGYFLYLGRFSEEKRPDQAIMLAKACKIHLKLAAKIDPADKLYFKQRIEPLLDSPYIEYVGEVDDTKKSELLRNARALLNPIDWPEPFGLVMIEALACGTPVIVRRCGSSPEVITHGVSGFICDSKQDFIRAIRDIDTISRSSCRREFDQRFTLRHMTEKYESLYRNIISSSNASHPVAQAFALNGTEMAV